MCVRWWGSARGAQLDVGVVVIVEVSAGDVVEFFSELRLSGRVAELPNSWWPEAPIGNGLWLIGLALGPKWVSPLARIHPSQETLTLTASRYVVQLPSTTNRLVILLYYDAFVINSATSALNIALRKYSRLAKESSSQTDEIGKIALRFTTAPRSTC